MDTLVLDQLQELDIQGFEPSEVHDVITNYVCAHCHAQLVAFNIPNDRIYMIVCSECANNVEHIGRVMRSTVSIEMERAHRQYSEVINNLPDLWGHLIPPKRSTEQNLKELGF